MKIYLQTSTFQFYTGIVVSSYFWGILSDINGRHKIMFICSPISLAFSILSSFSLNTWMLIVTRFFVGFFISSLAANTYAYLGEFHCEKNRGKYLNLCGVFMALGLTFCPALGWLIMKFDRQISTISIEIPFLGINFTVWRIFLLLCSSILFIITLSMFHLPESPKYLIVRKNQSDKALEILKKIHKLNTRHTLFPVSQIDTASENLLFSPQNKSIFTILWTQTSPLFKRPLVANTWKISYLMFSLFAVSSGLFMWIPEILNQILEYPNYSVCEVIEKIIDSKNSTTLTATCDHINVNVNIYKITLFMGAFFSVVYFFNGFIINKFGKINLNAFWFFVCGLSGILIPFFRNYYMILLLLVVLLTCGVCGSISSSIIVELFPTNVR
jgi:MFS transporter, VNT family, synaptic vesicle glycoprotein 2